MSDHDEPPDFSESGDPREEALWQAYQAMLRRRKEPRARWSAPEELPFDLTPEHAARPWPLTDHPLPPSPAESRAADTYVDTPAPSRPRVGPGKIGAGRWVALGSALVLAVGAALVIFMWSRGAAPARRAEPIHSTLPTAPAPSVASPSETAPAPITLPAPPPPQLFANASPEPHASLRRSSAAVAKPPHAPATGLARTRRAALQQHGGERARGTTGELSPRRASALAVRDFYNALARGDSARAEAAVVPDRRQEGPLSAGELTRYYSSLRTPLRVTKIDPIDDDKVFVRYSFVTADNHVCLGSAVVETTPHDGRALVSGVHVFHAC